MYNLNEYYRNYNNYSNSCISTNQVDLLENMNLVWQQHIMWTRMLLISIAENLGDLKATQTRLLQNPKDIANIFRKYYGNNIANMIEALITQHLEIGEKLIVALKNNNQQLATDLNNQWYRNADEIAKEAERVKNAYESAEATRAINGHGSSISYSTYLEACNEICMG